MKDMKARAAFRLKVLLADKASSVAASGAACHPLWGTRCETEPTSNSLHVCLQIGISLYGLVCFQIRCPYVLVTAAAVGACRERNDRKFSCPSTTVVHARSACKRPRRLVYGLGVNLFSLHILPEQKRLLALRGHQRNSLACGIEACGVEVEL